MRRSEKKISDEAVIREILEEAAVCRLGLTDGDEAYIVPVNFAWHDGVIWIHSAPEGRKMDLLRRGGRVAFEIEGEHTLVTDPVPCRWTTRYRSVMGTGTVTIHDDEETKRKGLGLILRKYGYPGRLTFAGKDLEAMVILKLKIETVTGKEG